MAGERILYFTSGDHYAYRRSGGLLELEAKFSADDVGVAAFREYVAKLRGALLAVVADLTGEDFHEDQIPFTRGSDRRQIIERRIAQRYRDTRLAAAVSLGEIAGERRNERLLLASFTNTQQFAPWLDAITEAGVKLTGIYSVPLLAPALAKRLGVRSGKCIVVSADRAGLRQSFVDDGKLRFARLEPTVERSPAALAAFVRSETFRLTQYLVTLRALPREGPPLQVVVIAPEGQRTAFESVLVSDARFSFLTVDVHEAAKKVGLRKVVSPGYAESLYLFLAIRNPPKDQFAQSEDRREYTLWQLQRATVAAGALGFAACAVYAGVQWLDVLGTRDRAATQRHEARTAQAQYDRITAAFPVTETTTANLRITVDSFTKIAERTASPESALSDISRVLDRFPSVQIDRLSWRVDRGDAGAATRQRAGGTPAPAPAPPGAAGARASDTSIFVEISGRLVEQERNDYRAITERMQRFSNALAADGRYSVLSSRLPFDVTSEGTLTAQIGAGQSVGDSVPFTILIARPL